MKKSTRNILIFVIVLVVLASAFSISGLFSIIPASVSQIAPSDYYLRPSFAYLKCEQVDCNPITVPMDSYDIPGFNNKKDFRQIDMSNALTATPYSCQDFIGISEGCQITLETINGDLDGTASLQQLDYYKVPSGLPFVADNAFTLCYTKANGFGYPNANEQNCGNGQLGYDNKERVTISMSKSDVLWIRFLEGTGAFSSTYKKVNNKLQFIISGTCFGLIDVNDRSLTSGQMIPGAITGDCLLRDSVYKNAKITSFDPLFNLNSQELDWVNLNAPHRVYTYLSGLEPAPFVYGNVQTYNNQFVFCQKATNTLYKIAKISSYGRTYQSVILDSSGIVGTVRCCEGDHRPNQVCQNNQWITITQAQCDLSIGKFCSESSWTPYGNKQVRQFSCVNNQCIPEIKTVQCNYNEDCGNDLVCQRGASVFDNKCVGIGNGDICGDAICTVNEQRTSSCVQDCGSNGGEKQNLTWLWILIGGLGLSGIIWMIRTSKKRK